ncbi:MAG: hypothetical protein WA777_06610 [Rhodanobacter sp.]
MSNLNDMGHVRAAAALAANAEDASIWRWFALLLEERRIRWCCSSDYWLVSVDNKHVATENSFDKAIRNARETVQNSNQPISQGAKRSRRVA